MNIPILIAGLLSLLAFVVHAIVGDKEHKALRPADRASKKSKETWVQARCGWHWVSVDLLLSGVVLVLLATTEVIESKLEVSLLLGIYFFVCGVVWLVMVLISKTDDIRIMFLGQWVFCFLMSGLIYLGS